MMVRQERAKKRVRPRLGITKHMLIVRAVWGNRIISPSVCTRIHHCREPAKSDYIEHYGVALESTELSRDGPWDLFLLYCLQFH